MRRTSWRRLAAAVAVIVGVGVGVSAVPASAQTAHTAQHHAVKRMAPDWWW